MNRVLLLFLGSALLLGGCDLIEPEDPTPVFDQVFGTENYDAGLDLLQPADGSLLVGGIGDGVPAPADGTIPTPNLTRLGPADRVRWSRLYDELQGGEVLAVHENGDGYAVFISTADRLRLVSVGPDGRQRRTLCERAGVTARSNQTLRRTRDGGFILAGRTPYTAESRHVFLVRLDSDGRVQWEQSFDGLVGAQAVVETRDDGFVLLGETDAESSSTADVLLVKVGPGGSEVWRRAYGTEEWHERGLAMISAGGGVVVVGQSARHDEDPSEERAYALRVASDGTKRWRASYGTGEATSIARTVANLEDDGFLLAGSRAGAERETDALLIRITDRGTEQWRTTFGEQGRLDRAYAALELHDGRLAVTGTTGPDEPSFGGADFDAFVRFVSPDTFRNAP